VNKRVKRFLSKLIVVPKEIDEERGIIRSDRRSLKCPSQKDA
jgi:hypothetical protein